MLIISEADALRPAQKRERFDRNHFKAEYDPNSVGGGLACGGVRSFP
jgi:hypothetical protein